MCSAACMVLTRELEFGRKIPMAKLTKRLADATELREQDYVIRMTNYVISDLHVFASGKHSYVLISKSLAA